MQLTGNADETHSQETLVNNITACLAQSRRPIALFLGAGCPMSINVGADDDDWIPLIPDVSGLTSEVRSKLHSSHPEYAELTDRLSDDLGYDANIEEILGHIRNLAGVVGNGTVHELDAESIGRLEDAVTSAISETTDAELPDADTPYDHVVRWIRAVGESVQVRVFTTNYDLLLEAALERNHVPFFDGFVGSRLPFLDTEAIESDLLPSRWARLYKLHGSVNWRVLDDGTVARSVGSVTSSNRLIHPSHLKYTESRRMPYLVMLDQLRGFLRNPQATGASPGWVVRWLRRAGCPRVDGIAFRAGRV